MSKKNQEVEEAVVEQTTEVAVAVKEDMAIEVKAPANTEMDTFLKEASAEDDGLDRFPRLTIDQKGVDATIGSLHCKEMAQEYAEMTVVLLKEDNGRILWPAKYKSDNDPLCRSHDGIVPTDDIEGQKAMSATCKECPYGQWSKDGKTPPECKEVKDLLVMDTETFIPMWIAMKSMAMSPTKNDLLRPLKLRKMSLTAKRSNLGKAPAHSCMFSFKLSTVHKPTDDGGAYIPVYSNITELSPDLQDVMVQIAMSCKDAKAHNARGDDEGQPEDGGNAKPF